MTTRRWMMLLSVGLSVFNLFVYYILGVHSLLRSLPLIFVFWGVIFIICRLNSYRNRTLQANDLLQKVGYEFVVFLGVILWVYALMNFGLNVENGYTLSLIYLVVSAIKRFVEQQIYPKEKVKKNVLVLLFVLFFIFVPFFSIFIIWWGAAHRLDIAAILRGIVFSLSGFVLVVTAIYEPRTIAGVTK